MVILTRRSRNQIPREESHLEQDISAHKRKIKPLLVIGLVRTGDKYIIDI
jgi:hypothetical protein